MLRMDRRTNRQKNIRKASNFKWHGTEMSLLLQKGNKLEGIKNVISGKTIPYNNEMQYFDCCPQTDTIQWTSRIVLSIIEMIRSAVSLHLFTGRLKQRRIYEWSCITSYKVCEAWGV